MKDLELLQYNMNNLNKYFDKIYIISSYTTQNRLYDLIPFLNKENIKFELIIAPKKKYIVPDYNKTFANNANQSLTSANESIFLKELYFKSKSFCILEDDVYFSEDYQNKLDYFFSKLPKNWDIINLGYNENTPINSKIEMCDVIYKLEKTEEIVGTHFVAYKNNVVNSMLDLIENSIYPMDWFLTKNVYSNFNVYTPVEKIFYASSYRELENYDNKHYKLYKSGIG